MGNEPPEPHPSTSSYIQMLAGRVREGDADALNQLLIHVEGRLRGLTRRLLRNFPHVHRWEQTDDVLQQALLRLHRSLQAVEISDLNHFLRLAALQIRRELLSLAKRYQGRPSPEALLPGAPEGGEPSLREDAPEETSGPSELALWTEFHRHVEELADPLREVFDLLYYHGLSQGEAAGILGVTDRTVRQRWRDARLALLEKTGGRLPGL